MTAWGWTLMVAWLVLVTAVAVRISQRVVHERMARYLEGEAQRWESYARRQKKNIVRSYMLNTSNNLREIAQKYRDAR